MTLRAPSRLASSEDMMLSSSSLVRASQVSMSSIFSRSSSASSVPLPCSTSTLSGSSAARYSQRLASCSMMRTL
ncbi:Uncharacterised protein [Bordetella pertussis]|nr:Uncharacterised protein [Bordetella pertussis]CPO38260.1 Uncharacterised protein [Bordetella pertussis]